MLREDKYKSSPSPSCACRTPVTSLLVLCLFCSFWCTNSQDYLKTSYDNVTSQYEKALLYTPDEGEPISYEVTQENETEIESKAQTYIFQDLFYTSQNQSGYPIISSEEYLYNQPQKVNQAYASQDYFNEASTGAYLYLESLTPPNVEYSDSSQIYWDLNNNTQDTFNRFQICPKKSKVIVRQYFAQDGSEIPSDACGNWTRKSPLVSLSASCTYKQASTYGVGDFLPQLYQSVCIVQKNNVKVQVAGVTSGSRYLVRIHIGGSQPSTNIRISVDGRKVVERWNSYKLGANGVFGIWKSFECIATSYRLQIQLHSDKQKTYISAIEVLELDQDTITVNPVELDVGFVGVGSQRNGSQLEFSLQHQSQITITSIGFEGGVKQRQAFYLTLPNGAIVNGGDTNYDTKGLLTLSPTLASFGLEWVPISPRKFAIDVVFYAGSMAIHIVHIEAHSYIEEQKGFSDHTLHPIIQSKKVYIDWDYLGYKSLSLDGSNSHTHSADDPILNRVWKNALTGQVLGEGQDRINLKSKLSVGRNQVELTLSDANAYSSATASFDIVQPDRVPGMLVQFYEASNYTIDSLQFYAPFEMVRSPQWFVVSNPPIYNSNKYFVRMQGSFVANSSQTVVLKLQQQPVLQSHLTILKDHQIVSQQSLSQKVDFKLETGLYTVDFRALVSSLQQDQPLRLITVGMPRYALSHSELQTPPVIRKLTENFAVVGETNVTVKVGVISYNPSDLKIHIDGVVLKESEILDKYDDYIRIVMPVRDIPGFVSIQIQSKGFYSNKVQFEYKGSQFVPVKFAKKEWFGSDEYRIAENSAVLTWCNGKLYTATAYEGIVEEHTFDHNWDNPQSKVILDLRSESLVGDRKKFNPGDKERSIGTTILGITCDPSDPSHDYRIYVSHSHLFAFGGNNPGNSPAPYQSFISELRSSDWDNSFRTIIFNLPTSGRDHSVNGLDIDGDGNLVIAMGGMTNAGLPSSKMGYLPESFLAGAILKCPIHDPNFDGYIQYEWWEHTDDALKKQYSVYDQRFGDWACQKLPPAPFTTCYVYSPGFRNPFDVVYTQSGKILATDNGPNKIFGAALNGPVQSPILINGTIKVNQDGTEFQPRSKDKLNLVVQDGYYGHPNIARGRCLQDPREFAYIFPSKANNPPEYNAVLTQLLSSSDGIAEYRASTFDDAIKGELFVSKYQSSLWKIKLTEEEDGAGVSVNPLDVKSAMDVSNIPNAKCLDVYHCPGGTLICVQYEPHEKSVLQVLVPQDRRADRGEAVLYDVFPWRAPYCTQGDFKFDLRGENLDKVSGEVSVLFTSGNITVGTALDVRLENDKVVAGFLPCVEETFVGELLDLVLLYDLPDPSDNQQVSIVLKSAFQFFKWV